MNATKIAIVVIVIVVIAGAAYLYTSSNPTSVPTTTNETMEEEVVEDSVMDAETNAVVINMTGADFSFNPSEITVKKGQTVRVVLTAGDMQHDFVIDELDVKSNLANEGDTVEVEFTPTEVGEFEYYCSVGNHRAQGMVGTLTVTE